MGILDTEINATVAIRQTAEALTDFIARDACKAAACD